MPTAAVPRYLAEKTALLEKASPGMQFTQYLSIWTTRQDQEKFVREAVKKKSQEAVELNSILHTQGLDEAIRFSIAKRNLETLWHKQKRIQKVDIHIHESDQKLMQGWRSRLKAEALQETNRLWFPAISTAPFVTGLGNEHPLENGFSFLWPYGVPYLPGSSVKGVIRQAFRELGIDENRTTALLGLEAEPGSQEHQKGALIFYDVVPEIRAKRLKVEIMNPHFIEYYQKNNAPHENSNPVPIYFLTVPEGSRFDFLVRCDSAFLERIAPGLLAEQDSQPRWQHILRDAFAYAFDWLGFGAKTRVGYGAMEMDEKAVRDLEEEKQEIEKAKHLSQLSEQERLIMAWEEKLEHYPAETLKPGAEHYSLLRQAFVQAESWDEKDLNNFVARIFIPWWKKVEPSKTWVKKNREKYPRLFQQRTQLLS
ncbi:MAG TPA: type III-B CRISPR module RAMP protein Cmr6 [Sulfurivirga caldicuralii]|nr:type III-B CRISPR module RAMP protein Cmr6 [Sulfurivirga caldicuralii]